MPVVNPVGISVGSPLNVPITNPTVNPVTSIVSQPTLVGQVMATPMGSPLVSAGFVGVFTSLGIGTKVKQRKMVAMKSQAMRSPKDSDKPSGDTASIGTFE
jgi:hypothetical protein